MSYANIINSLLDKQLDKKMIIHLLFEFVIFLILWFPIRKVTADDSINVQTENTYINVKWRTAGNSDKYDVSLQVMGTGYHSTIEVPGTQEEANITTILYPGSVYVVKLYAVHNDTSSLLGTRYVRSACGYEFNTTMGSKYSLLSPSYPNGYNAGVICRWHFHGNDVTWFKVILWDYDIEGSDKCFNSLQVSDVITLCHPMERNQTLLVKNSSISLQMINKYIGPGRGMNISVVAIHIIDKPRNLSANLSSHGLHLTWMPPLHHPDNFTYRLFFSFPPQYGDDLVEVIPANKNEYRLNVSDHIGQILAIGISVKSPQIESNRTYANIYIACLENIHLPPESVISVTSPGYPAGFQAGVNCRWYVHTEPDLFILVTRSDTDIRSTDGCTDAYVDITSLGKHCATIESGSVIQANVVNISFSSGNITSGRGFNITLESVAKPSGPPDHIHAAVNHTHIHVMWGEPPERSQNIIGFVVEYFMAPHTLGTSVHTDKGTREVFISTDHQSGRLFIIRVASVTKGGRGNYSEPFYIRSVCETTLTLSQHQTSLIFSPKVANNDHYQPGIMCKWIIQTAEPLWLQVTIDKFALEQSQDCAKDSLEISGGRKLCGQVWNQSFLLKKTSISMTFLSDFDTEDSGFVIAVTAVGPPPGVPQNINVTSSQYGLICTWDSPKQNEMYLTGYHLTYRIYPELTNHTVEITRDTRLYAIDTTYIPGRLVEVYIQAKGDVEPGPTSSAQVTRSSCGRDYSLTKGRRLYIASPKFPTQYDPSVSCNWSIVLTDLYSVRLFFITLDLVNMDGNNCSKDYVKISGLGIFCDKTVENTAFILHSIQRIEIIFETDEVGNGKGFVLLLDVINDTQSENIKSIRHVNDHGSDHHNLSSELHSLAPAMDLEPITMAYIHIYRTHGSQSHTKSSIQSSHPPEILPSFVSIGDYAFASSLQRRTSSASSSLLSESSSVMMLFPSYSDNMMYTVASFTSSSSDFAFFAGNDFSLATNQLAMTMSIADHAFPSSLQRGSSAACSSLLPESSSVMSPFRNYSGNIVYTVASFISSSLDFASFLGNDFRLSTNQLAMIRSIGDYAFASSLQHGSSVASSSFRPESSSVMTSFRNHSGNMMYNVASFISSSSDFASFLGNDFSLSTNQLAMIRSIGDHAFPSSLQHGSSAASSLFLPESSSVMSPFRNYSGNMVYTVASFTSSSSDHAFFDGKGYRVSTSQLAMTISMPLSSIHQILLPSAASDQKRDQNVSSVIEEYSKLVDYTSLEPLYLAMSSTYNHTAIHSKAQSSVFMAEKFCDKNASLYKGLDAKETFIEVASSFKTLDANYHVSNATTSHLVTGYVLSSNYSFISSTNKDVETSIDKEQIVHNALFTSQGLFIEGTSYSNIYSTITSNFSTITVSLYTRKPSNPSLSEDAETTKVNGSHLQHCCHTLTLFMILLLYI